MSTVHNTDVIEAPELYENTGSGRATWDERGNTVWEWQTAPGIYSREVSAQQLQALQAAELHLVDQLPGVTLTHSHWKRRYQNPFVSASNYERELVMPAKRKDASKTSRFEQFLKHLRLPE